RTTSFRLWRRMHSEDSSRRRLWAILFPRAGCFVWLSVSWACLADSGQPFASSSSTLYQKLHGYGYVVHIYCICSMLTVIAHSSILYRRIRALLSSVHDGPNSRSHWRQRIPILQVYESEGALRQKVAREEGHLDIDLYDRRLRRTCLLVCVRPRQETVNTTPQLFQLSIFSHGSLANPYF